MEFKEKKLTIKVSWGFNGYFNTPPEFHSSVEWSYEDEQTGDSLFQTSVNKASVRVRALLVEGGVASSAEAGAAVAQRCIAVAVNAVRMVLLVAVEMTGQEQVTVIMALTVTINKPEIVAVKAVNKASMPEAAKAAMIWRRRKR